MASGSFPSRGIAAVWGVRPPGRRGPSPGLSIGEIVAEAAALADAQGLDAVTLPAVATRVGVATNSLYRYVESKDELLLLLFDDGLGEPPAGLPSGEHWRMGARAWLEAVVERYAGRPWLLDIPLHGPPITPYAIGWLDSLLTALGGSSWDDDAALQLATLLDRLAHAIARLRVGVLDTSTDRSPGEQ
ncbi:MAG: TetR/AcrR family transcriptional regulator, partial [Nocardioidaceae bacterium]